jgi:hypothetical protein
MSSCAKGVVVAPGANCVISLTFAPTATGLHIASVTINHNAAGSPHVVSFSGTGTTPAAAPDAASGAGKPGSAPPCLSLKPEWIGIPKQESLIPVVISSCDTPAADLSKDTVKFQPVLNPSPTLSVDLLSSVCDVVTASELECMLRVAPNKAAAGAPKPSIDNDAHYYLQILSKTGQFGNRIELHLGERNLYWMLLGGIDATSTLSGPTQQWFARGSITGKVLSYSWGTKQQGIWGWMDAKLGSMPTLKTSALSSISSPSAAVSSSGIMTIGDIAQTFEFRTGLTFAIARRVGIISGIGGSSPINSITGAQEYGFSKNLYEQFVGNPSLQTKYAPLWTALNTDASVAGCFTTTPAPSGCAATTVAFVLPDRSRFYRDYFGGFRILTKDGDNFPGFMDVTLGQDETVTGGMLRGVVLTLGGDYPLAGGTVRVFGSVHLRVAANSNAVSLDMSPVTAAVSPTSPSVVIQPTLPLDQDYFRVGLAVDLQKIISALTTAKKASAGTGSQ